MKNTEAAKWINETKVSDMIGRATQTLRNDRHKRQGLPYYKIGGSIRYKFDEVIDHIEKHRIVPNSAR